MSIQLHKGRNGDNLFHRPFCDQLPLPVPIRQNHAHPSAGEIEGDLIHALIVFQLILQAALDSPIDHREVKQVFKARLEIAVQVSIAQNADVILAPQVHVFFQHDLILGQRPGFIGAEHIHFPERLDCAERTDDDLLLRHGNRAFGQR